MSNNVNLDDLAEGFLFAYKGRHQSARTYRWHELNVRLFLDWVRAEELPEDPARWRRTDILRYYDHLATRPARHGVRLSDYSVRSYATSLHVFLHWFHEEGYIRNNLAQGKGKSGIPNFHVQPLQEDEIRTLLAVAKADKRNGGRDTALLYFLLDTGCRAGEVCGLTEDEIDWQAMTARVHGKGNKWRTVVFQSTTRAALHKYKLKGRRDKGTASFFQTEEGAPLRPAGLGSMLKRLGQKAGVAKVHPHRFRHTFAISYLLQGGDVIRLQRVMGHSSLAVTTNYLALTKDDLVSTHEAFSPVENLGRGGLGRA